MARRTKTYIAGDWDNDYDAVEQLRKWNDGKYWSLSFVDAHDVTQSSDASQNCSIKKSLALRMDASKTFVLIVGDKTASLRSGSCSYCDSYSAYSHSCMRGNGVSMKSFIEYECEKAKRDDLKIVVLYYAAAVDRDKCPDVLRWSGVHAPMLKRMNGELYWDYQSVKDAIMS